MDIGPLRRRWRISSSLFGDIGEGQQYQKKDFTRSSRRSEGREDMALARRAVYAFRRRSNLCYDRLSALRRGHRLTPSRIFAPSRPSREILLNLPRHLVRQHELDHRIDQPVERDAFLHRDYRLAPHPR
jgi:hypothetical protein